MSIAAGKLRHKVMLQSFTTTVDMSTGDRIEAWADVGAIWAAVEPLSGREYIAAAATQSQVTARITIRYRAGVTAAQRIAHGVKVYNIEAVLADKNSGREYLSLMCSEGGSDG